MRGRTRIRIWSVATTAMLLAGLVSGPVSTALAASPTPQPFLGEDGGLSKGTVHSTQATVGSASLAAGFSRTTVFSGLTFPTNVRFASDGRVFVAEKSGLIKVFASLNATTPTIFADLRTKVDDYWDRGLLGLVLAPNFPADPYVYVAYTYDAPIGGAAPVWNDTCPSPPGPTTDGCVVSSRVSRLQASGNTMTGTEQVLINDWCQQFPSHSIGDLQFGPDGGLYVSGGEGANFNNADWGNYGGSAGSPTPLNPCNDPVNEGGALRSQDLRTNPGTSGGGGGGSSYRSTVLADSPIAYWRLGDTSGIVASDQVSTLTGWYGGTLNRGVPGAIVGDADGAISLDGSSSYVGVPDYAQLDLSNGPLSVEFWVKRNTATGTQAIIDRGPGSYQIYFSGTDNKLTVAVNGGGILARESSPTTDTTTFHHFVVTKSGTTTKVYRDGVDVTAAGIDSTLVNTSTNIWLGRWNDGTTFGNVVLDEVAIYGTALSASRVLAHDQAGLAGGTGAVAAAATDPVTLDGSIIRIDPTTGLGLPTNPLASSTDINARRIIAEGFRNPFRFTFRPGTSEIWEGDVGYSTWEEINRITSFSKVTNLGWPCYEGTPQVAAYASLAMCQALYNDTTAPAQAPYYSYNHSASVKTGDGCTTGSSSISGDAFYTGTSYPAQYRNALFFADYSRNCIWAMLPGTNGLPDPTNIVTIDSPAKAPVNLIAGPGGDLFYPDFTGGTIQRLSYPTGNQQPTARIVATPTAGAAPLTVSFSGTGSSDPEGTALTYAWDLDGNGQYNDATTATTSKTYATPGVVTVGLRVTDTGGASGTASVQINVGGVANTPPVPIIDTPATGLTWTVGDLITFAGHATDQQDGTIPATSLSWQLNLQHCPSNCHTHALQTFSGVAGGSFSTPDHDYPSWLELTLTATDSAGASASTTLRLDPKTVVLSIRTSTPGLAVVVAGVSQVTPYDHTAIRGGVVSLTAPSPQTVGGVTYTFSSWSDGGAASHVVSAAAAATFTATYTSSAPPPVSYVNTVTADAPVVWWRLGDTTGIIATDAAGTRTGWYGGTLTRGVAGAIVGDPNGAVSLDGTSGYVGVPSSSVPGLANGPLSVEFWVKRKTATGNQAIIDGGPGSYQIDFATGTNKLTVAKDGGGNIVTETGTTTDTTTWHHFVFTKNGAAVKLYKDGVDVTGTVTNQTLTNATTNLWIGKWNDGTRFGNLVIDEVALYNKVLTPAQVAAHRSAGLGGA